VVLYQLSHVRVARKYISGRWGSVQVKIERNLLLC